MNDMSVKPPVLSKRSFMSVEDTKKSTNPQHFVYELVD